MLGVGNRAIIDVRQDLDRAVVPVRVVPPEIPVQGSGTLMNQTCKCGIDLTFGASSQHDELQSKGSRRNLGFGELQLGIGIVRV
jgi:hypothetical protein